MVATFRAPAGVSVASMTFGVKLRELREGRSLTQQSLADAAGIPVGNVRNYEQGQRLPSFPQAAKLARALGVSLDELASCEDIFPVMPARPMGKRK